MTEFFNWLLSIVKEFRFFIVVLPWETVVRCRLGKHVKIWETRRWARLERCVECERIACQARIRTSVLIDEHGCWIWQRSRFPNGYGSVSLHGKLMNAHRLAYYAWRGEPAAGMDVCHHCDVRACCNPEHLFVGTRKDNMDDCTRKGRKVGPPLHIGERHPMARLSNAQVTEIRSLRASGVPRREIARRFGVRADTVSAIVHYRTRKSVA